MTVQLERFVVLFKYLNVVLYFNYPNFEHTQVLMSSDKRGSIHSCVVFKYSASMSNYSLYYTKPEDSIAY